MPFVFPSRVRFVDTDASGRIHYTAMLRHFEAAEAEFLRAHGLHYSDERLGGIGWPRVRVECDYTSPVGYDDLLDIAVSVERVGNSSFTLAFAATVAERPVAHGTITIVCLDLMERRARALPDEFASGLRRIAE